MCAHARVSQKGALRPTTVRDVRFTWQKEITCIRYTREFLNRTRPIVLLTFLLEAYGSVKADAISLHFDMVEDVAFILSPFLRKKSKPLYRFLNSVQKDR